MKLVKTAEIDPERTYIFGYHPHGILGQGAICNFATEVSGFGRMFPGIDLRILTLNFCFYLPFFREYILKLGLCSVSKKSIEHLLTKNGKGSAAMIVVGGASEALDARPGTLDLTLKNRKGFVKLALRHGADLVPVLCYGENEIFDQADKSP